MDNLDVKMEIETKNCTYGDQSSNQVSDFIVEKGDIFKISEILSNIPNLNWYIMSSELIEQKDKADIENEKNFETKIFRTIECWINMKGQKAFFSELIKIVGKHSKDAQDQILEKFEKFEKKRNSSQGELKSDNAKNTDHKSEILKNAILGWNYSILGYEATIMIVNETDVDWCSYAGADLVYKRSSYKTLERKCIRHYSLTVPLACMGHDHWARILFRDESENGGKYAGWVIFDGTTPRENNIFVIREDAIYRILAGSVDGQEVKVTSLKEFKNYRKGDMREIDWMIKPPDDEDKSVGKILIDAIRSLF